MPTAAAAAAEKQKHNNNNLATIYALLALLFCPISFAAFLESRHANELRARDLHKLDLAVNRVLITSSIVT